MGLQFWKGGKHGQERRWSTTSRERKVVFCCQALPRSVHVRDEKHLTNTRERGSSPIRAGLAHPGLPCCRRAWSVPTIQNYLGMPAIRWIGQVGGRPCRGGLIPYHTCSFASVDDADMTGCRALECVGSQTRGHRTNPGGSGRDVHRRSGIPSHLAPRNPIV